MPTKQELEGCEVTELAVLCGKVADSPSSDSVTAEKARQLREEWRKLILAITPPLRVFKEQQEVETKLELLKARMAEFLARIL